MTRSEEEARGRLRDRDILRWLGEENDASVEMLMRRARKVKGQKQWRRTDTKPTVIAAIRRIDQKQPHELEPYGGIVGILGKLAGTTYHSDLPRKPLCPECSSPQTLDIYWKDRSDGKSAITIECESPKCTFTTKRFWVPTRIPTGTHEVREASRTLWQANCVKVWEYVASLPRKVNA